MADAVQSNVLWNPGSATVNQNAKEYVIHLTCVSDATGETAVTKVDKSTLFSTAGIEPVALNVHRLEANVAGFNAVRLYWDHTTAQTIAVLGAGHTVLDFTGQGLPSLDFSLALLDPQTAGGTGDILLTSLGAAANASYDILLYLYRSTT